MPSSKQNSSEIQKGFLNALAETIKPETKVIVITDAGFRNAWFSHIKSLGWDFVGRIRGNTQLQLNNNGEGWLRTGKSLLATGRNILAKERCHSPRRVTGILYSKNETEGTKT